MAHQFQSAEIFQHRNCSAPENFYPFLRIRFVSVGDISDRALGTLGKLQRNNDIVVSVLAGIRQCASFDGCRRRAYQPRKEINKMTDFAENSSASLCRIVHPVVRRNKASIDSIMKRQGLLDMLEKTLHTQCQGSESPIEPDHEKRP